MNVSSPPMVFVASNLAISLGIVQELPACVTNLHTSLANVDARASCMAHVMSTFSAPSQRKDAVTDEIIWLSNRFKLVYVGRSISKFRRQMS